MKAVDTAYTIATRQAILLYPNLTNGDAPAIGTL